MNDESPVVGEPAAADNVTVLPVLTAPGGRLRAAREARGLGIGQVVEALRVEQRLVEAMEANEFGAFDAPVYARGFLRKYAQYLGLSPQEMIAELDALAGGPTVPTLVPRTTAAPPVRDWSKLSATLGVIGAAALVLGSFLFFHGRAPRDSVANGTHAEQSPAAAAGTAAGQTQSAAVQPGSAAMDPGPATPAPAPAAAPAVLPDPEPATQEHDVAAAPPLPVDPAPSQAAGGHASGHLRLELRGDSWVEVYGADGSRKVFGMLRSGEQREVAGAGPWRVLLGKADQVRVTLDGQDVVPSAEHRKGDTALYHVDAQGKQY